MKYTPENVETIINALKEGKFRIEACDSIGITFETFRHWQETHVEFAEQVKTAESEGLKRNEHKWRSTIEKASQRYWVAAAWLLERCMSSTYSQTVNNRLSGWVDMGETAKQREERKEKLKTFLTEVFIGADVKGKKGDSKEVVKI